MYFFPSLSFFFGLKKWKWVTQLCLTLCDPMDCRPPGSSDHGIHPEHWSGWVAVPFSRGSSQPRDRIQQLQISENSGTEIQSPWKLCHCRPGGDLYYCPSPKCQNMRANFMSKTASDWVEPVINRLQWGRPGFNPWIGKIPWRREWQPTVVFLPGESHGQKNLGAYSPWGQKESDTTERLSRAQLLTFIRRRQWQPTPVLLPGKSHGRRSLVGCSPWGR